MIRKDPLAEKLVAEYIPLQVKYQSFSELIGGIVGRLAKRVGRKYQMVACRSKEQSKLYEKILIKKREEGKVYNNLDDIEDLAGARIIFYLERDRKAFIQELYSELGKDVIISTQEQIKASGYRATHMIIKLDDARTSLPEYSEYAGMKCELQITSVLFHAWSEVEHDIIYKPAGNRVKLKELGLARLEGKFQELHTHIQGAAIQLDLIAEDYEEIRKFGDLLDSNLIKTITSSSNDRIIEILKLVERFINKKPNEIYLAVEAIFSKAPSEPETLGILGDREIKGKTHQDVEVEALGLLMRVRYFKPLETLVLLSKLIANKDGSVKVEAKKVLEKFVGYNYHFLKDAKSYYPQIFSLDFVLKWSLKERLENFDFVEIVCKEILGSNVEGSEWTKEDTLTYHFGAVPANDNLKSLRTRTLDLLYRLFAKTNNISLKLRILKVMEEASRGPTHVVDENVKDMIEKDAIHVLNIYKKMILSADGRRLIGRLSIIEDIESRLYWWPEWGLGGQEAIDFRKKIINDRFYNIARILVGNSRIYQREESVEKTTGQRDTSLEDLHKSITRNTLTQWFTDLNKIAKEREYIDSWQFVVFREFINNFAKTKPNLASTILSRAIREKAPLAFFGDAFLGGLKSAKKHDLWDRYIKVALQEKDLNITRAIVRSLYVSDKEDPKIWFRDSEITLLNDIVRHEHGFEFLKDRMDRDFKVTLFQVLCYALNKAPSRIEPLIQILVRENADLFVYFVDVLGFFIFGKTIDVSKLRAGTKIVLKRGLVNLDDLGWRAQELLLEFGREKLDTILDIFVARIKLEETKKSKVHIFDRERYDAIPHNINPELAQFISAHPDFPDRALAMLGKMTKDWSLYNWDVTHFFERVGSPGFMSIVKRAIQKGDEQSILNAAHCLSTTHNADIDICMQVIGKSKNKRVIGLIDQAILSTGVVSGEYGLANAYQSKADTLKPYLKNKNPKIRDYAEKTVSSLEKMSIRERQDTDVEKATRIHRFENGD